MMIPFHQMSELDRNDHWGHVTLLSSFRGPLYLTGPGGKPYVADTHGGPQMLRLRCDCGFEWEIERQQFPGRRKLRSCGRKECTALPQKPPETTFHEKKVSICISIPTDMVALVEQFRIKMSLKNFSRATEALIREALIARIIND
jgi:hypothetical protein